MGTNDFKGHADEIVNKANAAQRCVRSMANNCGLILVVVVCAGATSHVIRLNVFLDHTSVSTSCTGMSPMQAELLKAFRSIDSQATMKDIHGGLAGNSSSSLICTTCHWSRLSVLRSMQWLGPFGSTSWTPRRVLREIVFSVSRPLGGKSHRVLPVCLGVFRGHVVSELLDRVCVP